MASMTCAGPRDSFARASRAICACITGTLVRLYMGLARRCVPPSGSQARPVTSECATSSAPDSQQRYLAVRAQLAASEIELCSQASDLIRNPNQSFRDVVGWVELAGPDSSGSVGARPASIHEGCRRGSAQPTPTLHSGAWIDLLARVSHDLRTPLNAVIGFSDVMQRELFGPLGDARYQEYARHIRDSGDALLRAAEDTLAMTTLVASQSTCCDRLGLSALLAGAWNELTGRSAGRGIALELAVAPDLEIRADARAMRQILKHLLAASLARTPAGARLRVTAVAVHGRVQIELLVPELAASYLAAPAACGPGSEDLPLCLARTLLELQGSTLTEYRRDRSWAARTELEHAVQEDFFAPAPAHQRPDQGRLPGGGP